MYTKGKGKGKVWVLI